MLSLNDAQNQLSKYDIIVQTTSIGMHPNVDSSPISVDYLKPTAFVSDIIYTPLETKLLRDAKQKGARIQNGLPMFAYQGALQFEMWTGIFPDTDENGVRLSEAIRRKNMLTGKQKRLLRSKAHH